MVDQRGIFTRGMVKTEDLTVKPKYPMNDEERRLWVLNDEGLYRWWKDTGLALPRFIRENREVITEAVDRALGTYERKPQCEPQ